MFQVLLLSTIVLMSRAATTPSPCCSDRQFQAVIGRVGGTAFPLTGNALFIDDYQEMAYDFYRKRIGGLLHQRQPDGSMKNISYLLDYNTDRQYVNADNQCTITKIGMKMASPCIPSNATFLMSGTMGFGTESLNINIFEYVEDGQVIKMAVTASSCIPVISSRYGTVDKVATNIVEVYSSFKPGIDDPSRMEPSQYDLNCIYVDPSSTDSSSTIVGRRSLF